MRAVVLPFVPRDPAFQRINTATLGTELSLDLVEAPAPYGRPDDVRIKYAIKRAGNGAKAVRWYEFVYDGYELQVIRGALNGTPPGWFVEEPEEAPTEALFRPIIKLKGGALTENVDAAEANLLKADRKIFVYGEKIVRARLTHDIPIAKNRQATGTRLFEVGHHHLVESFTKTCAFYRFDKRAKKWHEVNCPGYIAATYMGRGDWRLPPLTAVINAPTLRPDGSILDKPGYDAETGILYEPLGVVFPSIPASPTRDEAIAALAELKAPIVGFPFVGGSDRSVALSGMLTAVVRPSLASAPLHGFDAPTPGSGKTKLASIPGVLVTGHEPSASNVGKAPEEVDKHLGSMLLCGDPVILLDNVTLLLDSALLCQILTQPRVTIRVLGKSEVRRCPTRTLVLATGNNLQLVGDLTRRCLVGRIDPQCEQPETRESGSPRR